MDDVTEDYMTNVTRVLHRLRRSWLLGHRVLRRWRRLVRGAALARVVKFIETMVWRHKPRMLPLAPHTAQFLVG